MNRTAITSLLVALLLPASAVLIYRAYERGDLNSVLESVGLAPVPTAAGPAPPMTFSGPNDFEAELMRRLEQSSWLTARRAFYRSALQNHAKGRFDVLVVPAENFPDDDAILEKWLKPARQEQARYPKSIDRVDRSLMSQAFADRLHKVSGARVVDPWLTWQALGPTARSFDSTAIDDLAHELGVSTVVRLYTGRVPPNDLRVAFVRTDLSKQRSETVFVSDPIRMEPHDLAYDRFRTRLDEAIVRLAFPKRTPRNTAPIASAGTPPLPKTLDEVTRSSAADPYADAYALMLFGVLAPEAPVRIRERFFERALLLIDLRLPEVGDDVRIRLLRSRALLDLDRRPAAMELLAKADTPALQALAAYAHGDVEALTALVSRIEDPWDAYFATMDLLDLRVTCCDDRRLERFRREIIEMNPDWMPVVGNRIAEDDLWLSTSPSTIKLEMDRVFPEPGLGLLERLQVSGGSTRLSDIEIAKLALEHAQVVLDRHTRSICCDSDRLRLAPVDYVDLLRAHVDASVLHEVDHVNRVQGLPERGLAQISELSRIYAGHPELTALEAQALGLAAARASTVERKSLIGRALETARSAMAWSGGQTRMANRARETLLETLDLAFESGWAMEFPKQADAGMGLYSFDYPARPFWNSGDLDFLTMGWDFEPTPVWDYAIDASLPLFYELDRIRIAQGVEAADALLARNEHRFHADPRRVDLLAAYLQQTGRIEAAGDLYRASVASGTAQWSAYLAVGTDLAHQGRYDDALDTMLKYPPFAERAPRNSVAISHYANAGGILLDAVGAKAAARRMHTIAADLRTGSEPGMLSELRLAIDGQAWNEAEQIALRCTQRYESPVAERHLLAIKYTRGDSNTADGLFGAMNSRSNSVQPWRGALVGLRRKAAGDDEMIRWLEDRVPASAGRLQRQMLGGVAVFALCADRSCGRHLADLIDRIGVDPKTPLHAAAKALVALRAGDAASASSLLAEPFSGPRSSYSQNVVQWLPLLARAGTLAGDTGAAESAIEGIAGYQGQYLDRDRFALALAKSILAAHQNSVDDVLTQLVRAHDALDGEDDDVLPRWYQLLEVSEWLAARTADPRIEKLLLTWAVQYQGLEPIEPIGYVLEAVHTKDPQRRLRAIAIAGFLDPASWRMREITHGERERAANWLEKNNPFADRGRGAGSHKEASVMRPSAVPVGNSAQALHGA
ncbi:MAG: hypothetical protein AB7Q97_04610 [Gammaproteobacteria bacterium]